MRSICRAGRPVPRPPVLARQHPRGHLHLAGRRIRHVRRQRRRPGGRDEPAVDVQRASRRRLQRREHQEPRRVVDLPLPDQQLPRPVVPAGRRDGPEPDRVVHRPARDEHLVHRRHRLPRRRPQLVVRGLLLPEPVPLPDPGRAAGTAEHQPQQDQGHHPRHPRPSSAHPPTLRPATPTRARPVPSHSPAPSGARSSAEEHPPYKRGVAGSNPAAPTPPDQAHQRSRPPVRTVSRRP